MSIDIKSCKCGLCYDTEKAEKTLISRDNDDDIFYYLYGFVCNNCKTLLIRKDNDSFFFTEEELVELSNKLNCKEIFYY